jgi:hypothetical protein
MRSISKSVQRTIAQLPLLRGREGPSFAEERSYVESTSSISGTRCWRNRSACDSTLVVAQGDPSRGREGRYLMSAKTPDAAGEWLVERYHQI